MHLNIKAGFTLSELLVGLGIIGLIAAFAIPKVLNASSAALANAKVHKAAQAVANGLEKWTEQNGRSGETTPANIMNMVQHNGLITDGRLVDWVPNGDMDFTCSPSSVSEYVGTCYQMPDGAVLYFIGSATWDTFGGNADNTLYFGVDPDGITTDDDTQSNTSAATAFFISSNGRLRERGRLKNSNHSLQPQFTPEYYQQ